MNAWTDQRCNLKVKNKSCRDNHKMFLSVMRGMNICGWQCRRKYYEGIQRTVLCHIRFVSFRATHTDIL